MARLSLLTRYQNALLLIALALALSACDGTTLGHFDVDEALPETRIEGNAVAAILPAVLPAMQLDVTDSESFQQEDFDFLTSVQLDALTLLITESSSDDSTDTLEDGTTDNFDFLTRVDIYISAQFDEESQRVLIGSVPEEDPQLTAATQQLSFTMTGVDILRFVEAEGGYEVEIQAVGDAPPDAVIFGGDVRYRVGIGFR